MKGQTQKPKIQATHTKALSMLLMLTCAALIVATACGRGKQQDFPKPDDAQVSGKSFDARELVGAWAFMPPGYPKEAGSTLSPYRLMLFCDKTLLLEAGYSGSLPPNQADAWSGGAVYFGLWDLDGDALAMVLFCMAEDYSATKADSFRFCPYDASAKILSLDSGSLLLSFNQAPPPYAGSALTLSAFALSGDYSKSVQATPDMGCVPAAFGQPAPGGQNAPVRPDVLLKSGTVVTATAYVNVRSGPGTGYPRASFVGSAAAVPPGTQMHAIGESSASPGWVFAQIPMTSIAQNGWEGEFILFGWVCLDYTSDYSP